jgi:hypothetical protein
MPGKYGKFVLDKCTCEVDRKVMGIMDDLGSSQPSGGK